MMSEEEVFRIPEDWRMPRFMKRQIEQSQSLTRLAVRMYRRGGAARSAWIYSYHVVKFCHWLKLPPDDAIKTKFDWAAMINEYIDYLRVTTNVSPAYANQALASLKKWLRINGIDVGWGGVEGSRGWQVERDRVPTKEDLRKILSVADLAIKVLAEVAISSGLRLGTILSLRLKDIKMEFETPAIIVKPELAKDRPRRGFITFLSPEAKSMVQAHLREREIRGEALTPESFLITAERPAGARITVEAADQNWRRLLKRVGMYTKGHRWGIYHPHTLRKYFSTWTKLSGVDSWVVEFFMGHRSGINQVYFMAGAEDLENPQLLERLMKEYRKALPALEIFNEAERVKELAETVEDQKRQFEEERRKFEEEKRNWERKFAELEAELDGLIALTKAHQGSKDAPKTMPN